MLHYKSMSNEELREIVAAAGAELLSRKAGEAGSTSRPHVYRITMRRTSKAEPQVFRFAEVEGIVVQIPLPLDQIIGRSGRLIGGEFLLNDGDVVQKIYSSGMILYRIAWQGHLERQDYDVSQVFEGDTEAETTAKIERFVRGDRTLLIQELSHTVSSWREQVAEYEQMGKTDPYWKRVAERDRHRISTLETMLDWARSTSQPERVVTSNLQPDAQANACVQ